MKNFIFMLMMFAAAPSYSNTVEEMKLLDGSWHSVSYQCVGLEAIHPTIYSTQRLDIKSGTIINTVSNLSCITREEIKIEFNDKQEDVVSYVQTSDRIISKHCLEESQESAITGDLILFASSKQRDDLVIQVNGVNCHGSDSVLMYFKRLNE